jgi:isopentenyl diphosphate isomerase/L-lactate dehydrogenase-like FMN-dependent dehydrogenase
VFSVEDIELVREVRPDVVVVSNHGGRVETARGSTADFLARYAGELRRYVGELWVDGGLRSASDLRAARYLGADEVMVARPLITALLAGGKEAVSECAHRMTERALSPDPVSRNT